jgi:hypothetical protein
MALLRLNRTFELSASRLRIRPNSLVRGVPRDRQSLLLTRRSRCRPRGKRHSFYRLRDCDAGGKVIE